jgi:hypothetical protein
MLMPCLSEAETLATCLRKAKQFIDSSRISAEILVAQTGSTYGSSEIPAAEGASLVPVPVRGYGAVLLRAFPQSFIEIPRRLTIVPALEADEQGRPG